MAIIPEKINFNNINEIKKGDAITPETINAPLKASAYAQEIADAVKGVGTNQPNNDNANNVGEPRVEIETLDGTKRLSFYNLKGEKGEKGDKGDKGDTGKTSLYIHDFYIYSEYNGEFNYEIFIHIKMLSSQATRFNVVSDVFDTQQLRFKGNCIYFCVAKNDTSNGAMQYEYHESIRIYNLMEDTNEGYTQYDVYCNGFVLDMCFNTNSRISYNEINGITEL